MELWGCFTHSTCSLAYITGVYDVEEDMETITDEMRRLKTVKENILIEQRRQKEQYDHEQETRWGKLDSHWAGPYKIMNERAKVCKSNNIQSPELMV